HAVRSTEAGGLEAAGALQRTMGIGRSERRGGDRRGAPLRKCVELGAPHAKDATPPAHPEKAARIGLDLGDCVVVQAVLARIARQAAVLEAVETAIVCADPDHA